MSQREWIAAQPPTRNAHFFFDDYNFFVCAGAVAPRIIAVAFPLHRRIAAGGRAHRALVRLPE
jgi:hypothetical protein